MSRSLKKIPFFSVKLFKNVMLMRLNILEDLPEKPILKLKKRLSDKSFFITTSKNFFIFPYMVGLNLLIYNGVRYSFLVIKDNMIGHKVGEFLVTKALGMGIHQDKKKKKKNR